MHNSCSFRESPWRFLTALMSLSCGLLFADDASTSDKKSATILTIGRDSTGKPLLAHLDPQAFNYRNERTRVLMLVDVGNNPEEYELLRKECLQELENLQDEFCLAYVFVPPQGDDGTLPATTFPPQGPAYHTESERLAATIWRFTAWFAPDIVVQRLSKQDPQYNAVRLGGVDASKLDLRGRFYTECSRDVCGFGSVPGIGVVYNDADPNIEVAKLFNWQGNIDLIHAGTRRLSPVHQVVRQRLERTPQEFVEQQLEVYGKELKEMMYQPALSVWVRLERAIADQNQAEIDRVGQLLEPYLSGAKPALPEKASGSHFAGHLVLAAWARHTQDARAIALVKAVADKAFDNEGMPLAAMPTHSEMSDAVFMACPILTAAAELTNESKYLHMAQRHLAFMQQHCIRPDGLYRHSPLCEAPWGRGNGFPALGLALCLSDLDRIVTSAWPEAMKEAAAEVRPQFLTSLQRHIDALLPYQDPTGMWQQVIDEPVSYRELTATCMIAFALERGIQRGWLKNEICRTAADKAWEAVLVRSGSQGELFDVCTGTGKQKTLEDYFNRTAILGPDERGGAMVLMLGWERCLRLK